ncbi:MAG: hypothetical protein EPN22_12525 [Nitrospirae bacterium]|nr:MAG: hypothetical protein EPN22_12525 [Nitrospirota bacterium]
MKSTTVYPSAQKLAALKALSTAGVKVSDGYDYLLNEYILPESTLESVQKSLSHIASALSDEVVEARNS